MAAFDHLETYTEPKELISIFQHKGDLGSAKRERRNLKRGSKEVRSHAHQVSGVRVGGQLHCKTHYGERSILLLARSCIKYDNIWRSF